MQIRKLDGKVLFMHNKIAEGHRQGDVVEVSVTIPKSDIIVKINDARYIVTIESIIDDVFEHHEMVEGIDGGIAEKYYIKASTISTCPECWNKLKVEIYQRNEDETATKIGEYERGYSNFFNTFVPFIQHGKEYALYSDDYTRTRVMTLPDCKDLCGEEGCAFGFCPVDYYVPYDPELGIHGEFGFVSGCIWGDDSCMKIELLDLREISQGKFIRKPAFGYLELPDGVALKDAVDMDNFFTITVDGEEYSESLIMVATRSIFELDDDLNAKLLSGRVIAK